MRIFKKFLRILAILLPCLVGVLLFTNNSYALTDLTVSYSYGDPYSDWDNVFPNCSGDCLNGYQYLIVDVTTPILGSINNPYVDYNILFYYRNDSFNGYLKFFAISLSSTRSIYAIDFTPGSQDGAHNVLQFYGTVDFPSDITFTLTESLGSGPSGSLSITENGTYDVTSYAQAVVDVPAEILPGDYDDEFDGVITAIYICGASAIMIYFFYIIYGIFIKPTGGQK